MWRCKLVGHVRNYHVCTSPAGQYISSSRASYRSHQLDPRRRNRLGYADSTGCIVSRERRTGGNPSAMDRVHGSGQQQQRTNLVCITRGRIRVQRILASRP